MQPQRRTFLIISLALILPLALVAPPASTHDDKGDSHAPDDSQGGVKITDGTSQGADAYKKLLPDLAAAHRKKLDEELERLGKAADELAPRLAEAQKKTGFDAETASKEFREAASARDPAELEQRLAKLRARYAPQMQQLSYSAGLNIQAELSRLTTLVNFGNARPVNGSFISAGGMDESKREEPPSEPDVTTKTFAAPYTSQGHSDERAQAEAATGRMSLWNVAVLAGSSQKLAFITQDLVIERGVRRVRVHVTLDPTSYSANAFNLSGYSSAEAIVNLRLLEGSRILASDRISLGRAVVYAVGHSRVGATRPVTLQCEFTRPAPGDATTYTLVAEIEGWAGAGGVGGADVNISTLLRQFQVYLHRS